MSQNEVTIVDKPNLTKIMTCLVCYRILLKTLIIDRPGWKKYVKLCVTTSPKANWSQLRK